MALGFSIIMCQRCLKMNTLFSVKHIINQPRSRVFVTALPLSAKHTWVPHEKKPNRFVYMYRDIHGPVALHDQQAAREFVYALNQEERDRLIMELQTFQDSQKTDSPVQPTTEQLRLVFLHQALPFIGFGFLDNFLMIVAGEYIDAYLGVALGISTMAAAGLGNLISDVAGVGSAHHVETIVGKFGVKAPHLTPIQVDMKSTRWTASLGKMLGITIGCLLGMCPLFFFKKKHDGDKDKEVSKESKTEVKSS